jgi:hypothetical protein
MAAASRLSIGFFRRVGHGTARRSRCIRRGPAVARRRGDEQQAGAVPIERQNAFGKPACSRTPFAVWRLTIPAGTGKRRS